VVQNNWETPPLLTGGQKTVFRRGDGGTVQLSLDWYSTTLHSTEQAGAIDVEQVQLAASVALDCEPGDWQELDTGKYGYTRGMVGPGGAQVWWAAPGRDDVHVSLPGKACGIAGQGKLVHFLRYTIGHGGKATRCDTAMDDYGKIVDPEYVRECIQGPDVVTHAKKWLRQQGGNVGSTEITGETCYLGSASSRQRLRVYDKELESGGERECVRWELESKKEAAETMAVALAYHSWGEVFASRLVGYVDFRDAESHSEVEKRSRLAWFSDLVGRVRKASAYLPKPARTVEQVVSWLDKAIGPCLAVAMSHWGGEWGEESPLSRMITGGMIRWRPKHRAMLAAA